MSLPGLLGFWGSRDPSPNVPTQEEEAAAREQQPQQPPPPLEVEDFDHHQVGTDQHLWTQYLARVKPDITPSDPSFQAQLQSFHTALQHAPIASVLQTHFAAYDVWRFLQGCLPRKQYPVARARQDRDTAAYKALMTSHPDFAAAPGRDTLAFKCTMMYFGLPVQPMLFADASKGLSSSSSSSLFSAMGSSSLFALEEDEDEAGDGENVFFVPEEMRPLKYLNYYDRRGHGSENAHSMFISTAKSDPFQSFRILMSIVSPDKACELFYTIPMTLRGGDASESVVGDNDDQDSAMHDHDLFSSSEGNSLDGSETTRSPVPSDTDDPPLRGGNEKNSSNVRKAKGELALWGLSGRTIANFSHGLGSFFWAIDRLLGLRSRGGGDENDAAASGGTKGITVSILGHPQGQRIPCTVLWDGLCMLGNRRRETVFLEKLGLALEQVIDGSDFDNMEWEICVSQMSMDKYFKDSQADVSYRPCLQSNQVALFSLSQDQEGALAYLFMPTNVNAETAENHYQGWFKSLWRILSTPDPKAEKSYPLGSSAVQPPQSRLVRITERGVDKTSGTEYFHSDVGPPREVWEWLVDAYHTRGQREFVMEMLPTPVESKEGSLVHIPGYFRGADEKTEYKTIMDLFQVALESVPQQDRPSLEALRIRPLGSSGFLDMEGACVLCQGEEGRGFDPEYDPSSQQKLEMWLGHGYTLHVQPQWLDYQVKLLVSDGTPLLDHQGRAITLTFNHSEPWPRILARVRESYYARVSSFSKDVAIIRVDQRVVGSNDIKHKNRTRWDLEAVDTPEASKSWIDFVQSLTTKQVTFQIIPKIALSKQELSNTAPFSLREQQPDNFYWGCHDHPDDVVALYEEDDPEATAAAQHHHTHTAFAPGARHVPERDVDFQRRTIGWEDPRLQTLGRNDLDLDSQGLPARGSGLDDFQRGRIFREWSYGHPLSIHMDGQYPEIPVNAPPLEPLLKVPGPDGGVSDSVPMMSTQLMTATEQRRLQEAFFKVRSLALHRVQECPFPGCWKYFPVDEEGTKKFQAHIKNVHVGKQCPFCPDILLDSWAPWQIAQHFTTKHIDEFSHKGDLRRDLTVPIHSKGLVHSREEQFTFCPRCGRNHSILDAKADRAQHDNLCYPGNSSDAASTKYCVNCGKGYTPSDGLFPHQAHEQECKAAPEQREEAMHCQDCGLPTHEFSRRYAHKHVLFCKGADCNRANWCPWCGIDLALTSRVECYAHLDTCAEKPYTGKNPICTSTGEPLNSPRDTAEIRRRAQHFQPMSQQFVRIEVPKMCPIRACTEDLSVLNAGGLFKHFYGEHAEATNGMKFCPICHLDFQARGWAHLDEKTRHLDDHMERREERILGDLQVSRAKDRGDPGLQEGLQRRDVGDDDDQFAQLVATEEQLAQARDAIIELQRDRKNQQREIERQSWPEEEEPRRSQRTGRW